MGNIVNRVFDSSGPEGKVRGTPQQIIDKYNQLARDAQLANDRVAAENFQQHAEHYARLLGEAQREQDARREQQEAQQNRERQQNGQQGQPRGEDEPQRDDRGAQPQPQSQPQSQSQPDRPAPSSDEADDVIDLDGGADSGLVETPEEKAPRRRSPRKPRAKAGQKSDAEADGGSDSDSPAPRAPAAE